MPKTTASGQKWVEFEKLAEQIGITPKKLREVCKRHSVVIQVKTLTGSKVVATSDAEKLLALADEVVPWTPKELPEALRKKAEERKG